jgi:hypothetical protein
MANLPKRRKKMRHNYFRAPVDNVIVYIVLGVFVAIASFLSGAALPSLNIYVTMAFASIFVTGTYSLAMTLRDRDIDRRMDRYLAEQSIKLLLEGPVKLQVAQIITDYRRRKMVFPNQVQALFGLLNILNSLTHIATIPQYDKQVRVEALIRDVEQKKFGNVKTDPKTLDIVLEGDVADVYVAGNHQLEKF